MNDSMQNQSAEDAQTILGDVPHAPSLGADPVAEMTIRGLALLYFSDENKRAELGFINEKRHLFILTINGERNEYPIPEGSVVTINSNHIDMGNVLHSSNNLDFRQIVDLNQIHDNNVKLNSSYQFFAKVLMNKATFFTTQKSVYPVKLIKTDGSEKQDLGRIGTVGGARFYDDDFDIKIDGKSIDLRSYSRPYEIVLKYQCLDSGGRILESDFGLVYDALDLSNCTDKNRYNLKYHPNEPFILTPAETRFISKTAEKLQSDLLTDSPDLDSLRSKVEDLLWFLSCEVACQIATIGTKTVVDTKI